MYTPIIGLEVHIQLNTKKKMFCSCSAETWQEEPNTHTCPVCLGLPGALPVPNKEAIEKTIKLGLGLGCEIAEATHFDRKNYFYPDLPKGYQISQFYQPLCIEGEVTLSSGKEIRIREVHLEEDTGKSIHREGLTLLDYNKSGLPLAELVTRPDFRSAAETVEFAKKIRRLVRFLDVSGGDMEKGNIRLEANISLKESDGGLEKLSDEQLPGYKVEVKNINSFKFLEAVIGYEITRQKKLLEDDKKVLQETRGYNEQTQKTFTQRSKEVAKDYRYFPEPDIPPIEISTSWLAGLKDSLPKTPEELKKEYKDKYSLSNQQINIFLKDETLRSLFEKTASKLKGEEGKINKLANLIINKKEVRDKNPNEILDLLKEPPDQIEGADLLEVCRQVVKNNPEAAEDYCQGKKASLQFLIGHVMKKTKGKASPPETVKVLKDILS